MAEPITATTNAVRGINTPPWLAGALRGGLEAVVCAAFVAAGAFVASADAPVELQAYTPVLIWLFRTLEGLGDQIDPTKDRSG